VRDSIIYLSEYNDRKTFSHNAKILSIEPLDVFGDDYKFKTLFVVEDLTEISEQHELRNLLYSLTFIHNLSKPELHFRRGYRSLPPQDYKTIVDGELFVARTGYYDLLRALPSSLYYAFEAEELRYVSQPRMERYYINRLSRLYKFIQTRIMSIGKRIGELEIVIGQTDLGNKTGADYIHLITDESEGRDPGDDIFKQSQYFKDLDQSLMQSLSFEKSEIETRKIVAKSDVISQIIEELQKPERRNVENRFERIFENKL
jgi:hypothetical protein